MNQNKIPSLNEDFRKDYDKLLKKYNVELVAIKHLFYGGTINSLLFKEKSDIPKVNMPIEYTNEGIQYEY